MRKNLIPISILLLARAVDGGVDPVRNVVQQVEDVVVDVRGDRRRGRLRRNRGMGGGLHRFRTRLGACLCSDSVGNQTRKDDRHSDAPAQFGCDHHAFDTSSFGVLIWRRPETDETYGISYRSGAEIQGFSRHWSGFFREFLRWSVRPHFEAPYRRRRTVGALEICIRWRLLCPYASGGCRRSRPARREARAAAPAAFAPDEI